MFFKELLVKDETRGKKFTRNIVVAAMLGTKEKDYDTLISAPNEAPVSEELFYSALDYTGIKDFKKEQWREEAETQLTDELRAYGYTPVPDKLDLMESKIESSIAKAYLSNKLKKETLYRKLAELEKKNGDQLSELHEEAKSQAGLKIVQK